jgi:membrane fusion protein (multidrug efflux system)
MAAQFSQTTRSLRRDSARFVVTAWVIAGLFLAGWVYWFVFGTVTTYEVSTQARVEVKQSSHAVQAVLPGKVLSSALAMGAEVQAGDVLMTLDNGAVQLRIGEEETRLSNIPQQIASLEREINSRRQERASDLESAAAATASAVARQREAEAAMEFAREYEQKLRQLSASGLVASVDMSRAAADTKKFAAATESLSSDIRRIENDARTRVSQHEATIESLRHQVALLEGGMASSRAAIASLSGDKDKYVVRAPISGRLGNVTPLQPGAYVTAGQQLATIVPVGDLMLVADFEPSLALGRVRAGQQARLRLDGFPWAQYGSIPATVTQVAREIRDDVVRVELSIDAGSAGTVPLQHGLPGTVEVSLEDTSPAALVLRAAGVLLSQPSRPVPVVAETR